MSSTPHRRFSIWLCLAAYVIAGLVGARGFVLCLGPSGHVALEANGPGGCGGCLSTDADEPVGPPAPVVEQAPACPCDDITLPRADLVARKAVSKDTLDPGLRASPLDFARAVSFEPARIESHAWHRCAAAKLVPLTRRRSAVLLV